MNLVKWIRKNMTKLMAIFVILIMIAFIMPGLLRQLSTPKSRRNPVIADYAGNGRITSRDIAGAAEELNILRGLYGDQFLMRQNDFRTILLGQLLFPESAQTVAISDNIKRAAMQNRFDISPVQIDEFFAQARGKSEVYWILLKAEAATFGCGVSMDSAAAALKAIIPQLTDGTVQADTLVSAMTARRSVTQEQVIKTFADLLAVMAYGRIATSCENVTTAQLRNTFARNSEKIDAEFVRLDASTFIDEEAAPAENELQKHFELYRDYFPHQPGPENPFGFGYKQRPKAAIEYMIVMLDDVKKLISPPTEAETENFYQRFASRFTEQVRSDANDPNSPMMDRQKTYAEVADAIKNGLMQNKINAKATEILGDATEITDAGFENLDFDKASGEDFKKAAGNYAVAAEQAGKKYGISIHTGRTALITAQDIQNDEYLGMLAIKGQSQVPVRLATIAFAVEELGVTKLGPFDIPTPKMYQSIGPMRGAAGRITGVARIVDAARAAVPENINLTYKKNLPKISSDSGDDIYSLKEIVAGDYKRLKAFEIAESKAGELIRLITELGWDGAIEKFNELYAKNDVNDVGAFEITSWNGTARSSAADVELIRRQFVNNPASIDAVNMAVIQKNLVDKFYSLFSPQQSDFTNVPVIVQFQPQAAYYVIKSLSRNLPSQAEYDQARAKIAYSLEYISGQSMTPDFLLPDNIL
ncbi:MAG: hypothetical protein GWO86_02470, partial [Planctomycetes bacterium]|nr:hypothetical protein [Planctomycetota bacterium]